MAFFSAQQHIGALNESLDVLFDSPVWKTVEFVMLCCLFRLV